MAINVSLEGVELSRHLASTLSDLEFEMLVRERINMEFARVAMNNSNLSDSYHSCTFTMSWGDEAQWRVGIGENYKMSADVNGQVLSKCITQVETIYNMKHTNKLSRLLPAPRDPIVDADIGFDKIPF